jgi:hypothetical protein
MRCYFLREGRIEAVELLESGSDEDMIAQARALYQVHASMQPVDSFEIWSGRRFVYRWAALHADKSGSE